jgi:sortase A
MKFIRYVIFCILILGVAFTTKSGWYYVKGILAQHLLNMAWFTQQSTGEVQKAWDWSDSVPAGKLIIPSIDLSHVILDNANNEALAFGPGHIEGTSFPGESGNIGIAGHRDSFFKQLENISEGDFIGLEYDAGLQIYQVSHLEVIEPNQTEWLNPTNFDCLTLVTCYPFQYDGDSPQRYIVRANSVYSK